MTQDNHAVQIKQAMVAKRKTKSCYSAHSFTTPLAYKCVKCICKNMSVIFNNFGYVSWNMHRVTLYSETWKLLEAMEVVLCMQVEILLPKYCKNVLLESFPIIVAIKKKTYICNIPMVWETLLNIPLKCPPNWKAFKRTFEWHIYMSSKASKRTLKGVWLPFADVERNVEWKYEGHIQHSAEHHDL